MTLKILKFSIIKSLMLFIIISSCTNGIKGADARKIPANMTERQRQNIEEGRGFSLGTLGGNKSGEFDFASYSGGIIVTDWYSSDGSIDEAVKISIRFLSNEIRSDALSIKVFYKKCSMNQNCQITDQTNELSNDIEKKILTKAALYEKQSKSKKR